MRLDEFYCQIDNGLCDFQQINVSDSDFDGMHFCDLNFTNAKFSNVNIYRTEFENCIFNESDFSNTIITETEFKSCIFNNSNFIKCEIEESSFTNSLFVNANFIDFRANDLAFNRCNLERVKFTEICMISTGFYSSNLSKSQWNEADWSGSLTECTLFQAHLNDLNVGEVIIINTIYPNGTVGDLDWYDIVVKGEPPTPEPPITIHSKDKVELKSETATDYSILRDLLSECRWKAAQHKTHELIANLQGEGVYYLTPETLANIPCTDLVTIDGLWVEYSWGQFGFSIQKEIWMSIYERYERNSKKYDAFLKQIWTNKLKNIDKSNDEESIKLFPAGYYPNFVDFFIPPDNELGLATLYHHLSECKI